jgi:hypothetical protein
MLAYYTVVGNCGYDAPEIENTWSCHTIISGDGVGQYPSLVATTASWGWAWYISYYDGGSGDLSYARPVLDPPGNCGIYGDDMACYSVTVNNDVGRYSSLYVDSGGRFHIAYYDATEDSLMYAVEVASGGNCGILGSAQCDEIDAMPADYHPVGISIAEDGAGYPIIAYQGELGSLNVARPLNALGMPPGSGNCGPEADLFQTWYCEEIDPPGTQVHTRNGDFISIAVDSSGLATIAYYRIYVDHADGNLVIAMQSPLKVFLPLTLRGY